MNADANIVFLTQNKPAVLLLSGSWRLADLGAAWPEAESLVAKIENHPVIVDARAVENVDVNGVVAILALVERLSQAGLLKEFQTSPKIQQLVTRLEVHKKPVEEVEADAKSGLGAFLENMRLKLSSFGNDVVGILFVVGIFALWIASFGRIGGLRFKSLITHMNKMGVNAIPVVAVSSFVVGGVIAQQASYQLKYFGAETLAMDLSSYLIFRELAVLVAAIMVAGRSASAIAAEIGTMKMREEVDAMKVIGIDPYAALVVPRIAALTFVLPLLSVIASVAGIFGAAVLMKFYSGFAIDLFMERMREIVVWQTVVSGIVKAPFMAFAIGAIACREGLKVGGSAASLGHRTTSAVVKSIFAVFLLDGFFSLFFAALEFG